jgi:hypothetical protein
MSLRLCLVGCVLAPSLVLAQSTATPPARSPKVDSAFVAAHHSVLSRARVWFKPDKPIAEANLGVSSIEPDGFRENAVVNCTFKIEGVAGSTPKFTCTLPDGDEIKVKYGRDNPEVYTEVVATRLLNALGFPADRMYPVAIVRCFGCPADPFKGLQCLNEGAARERCFPDVNYERYEDFEYAVIERPREGRRIETTKERGWSWEELALIDAKAGGSSRAEVDALRLLAVFLGHWDNKAKNQRLFCVGEPDVEKARTIGAVKCDRPVAMVQDLGATFGPDKLNFERWSATPIWTNADRCAVSMHALPYGGSTFRDVEISEDGRAFLANLLGQLSTGQIRALFAGARVSAYPRATESGRNIDNWVRAFQTKVDAIVNRSACR